MKIMKEVKFVGSGSNAIASITVGGKTTTYKWELAQFVPDFIKALEAKKAAVGPENLILFVEKFKNYLRIPMTKEKALNSTVGNYMAQIKSIANGESMWFI